jgi:hypothetical protein
MGKYYHLPLYRATTPAVQTAAPVPEIMDMYSYLRAVALQVCESDANV